MRPVRVTGVGGYLPEKIVINCDLPQELDTSDDWIVQRTGIKQRQISSDENENTSQMGAKAGAEAIKNACLKPEDVDLIIFATTTPNKIFPGCATQVQAILECKNAFCFDLQAVCSGFLYSYYTAVQIMTSDSRIKNVLVIGAEQMSKILNWQDRTTCILFGDGAGAAILSKTDNQVSGYIDGIMKSNGELGSILEANYNDFLKMDGKKVFVIAVVELEKIIREICDINNIQIDDIKYFLVHQANIRILQALANNLKVDNDKFLSNIDKCANTSAASIPLLINDYKNQFRKGDLILMAGIGAGMTWGATLLRW